MGMGQCRHYSCERNPRNGAKRFKDKGELLPWAGVYRDWRTVSGMRVPFEAEVSWQLATGEYTYAHWFVESMDYDETRPMTQDFSRTPQSPYGLGAYESETSCARPGRYRRHKSS